MRLILLGGPGAGKGTQAVILTQKYHIPHISTGHIFRKNIRQGTELGKQVKEYLEKGTLVPDALTNMIVKDRLKQDDCANGFLLDGYPRTLVQAEEFDEILANMKIKLDKVLNIYVEDEEIVERVTGRRLCSSCTASYHIQYNPPNKEGICDSCGSILIQREDDKLETVQHRLEIYHTMTEPLIEYYDKKGLLATIHGHDDIDEITKLCMEAVEQYK